VAVILALDAGTGGAKGVVFDVEGRVLGWHAEVWEYEIVANAEVPIVKECAFDPETFWKALCECGRRALGECEDRDVIGVICTSQREGCVFLDRAGREIYAGPNLDSRGFLEGLEILELLGAERLYEITGHSAPFIFPLARLLWFRKHDDRPVSQLLMINDWISYRLCGAIGAEPSNASESMLFDFRRREWSAEILGAFDIPAEILPPLRFAGEVIGEVRDTVADELGIARGTPVFEGGADTQCALLGTGAVNAGDTGLILGTTSPLQRVLDAPVLDPAAALWAGCHVVPQRWVIESNMGSTGDAYRWLLELLLSGHSDPHARVEELAGRGPSDGTFQFVGPRIFDLSKVRPDMPGGIFFRFPSLQMRPDAGELLRSFFESIGFAARANLEQIERVVGAGTAELFVGGGLSRSDTLVQLIADIAGVPVRRAAIAESTALGCAVLVAAGAAVYDGIGAAAAAMCRTSDVEPRSTEQQRYTDMYGVWRELYDRLEELSV
jgi:sugar (pentulose or hexulose) kinase